MLRREEDGESHQTQNNLNTLALDNTSILRLSSTGKNFF